MNINKNEVLKIIRDNKLEDKRVQAKVEISDALPDGVSKIDVVTNELSRKIAYSIMEITKKDIGSMITSGSTSGSYGTSTHSMDLVILDTTQLKSLVDEIVMLRTKLKGR